MYCSRGSDIPLDADFLVLELLRLDDQRAGVQRAELVAGGRQIRHAVGAVDGQLSIGLTITAACGDILLSTRVAMVLVFMSSADRSKRSIANPADHLEPARDFDGIVDIARLRC